MLENRFASKFTVHENGCWVWHAERDRNGYGLYSKLKRDWVPGTSNDHMAHRFCFEALKGPIPEGLVLDHLCRNTSCVNPDHLEPVTYAENFRRGAGTGMNLWAGDLYPKAKSALPHCKHGHAYTPENTYVPKPGRRKCRACIARDQRAYQKRKKSNR